MASSAVKKTKQKKVNDKTKSSLRIEEKQEVPFKGIPEEEYYSSSLFNLAYLQNDLKQKSYWKFEQDSEFLDFKEKLVNLVDQRSDDSFETWSESETIHNWVVPVMEALGWQTSPRHKPFLEETSFVVVEEAKKKTYRTDLLYVESEKEKKYIKREKDAEGKIREAKQRVQIILEAKYWDRLNDAKADRKRSDRQKKGEPRFSSADAQTLKYMKILDKDWGIVTDGKTWRLLHKEDSNTSNHRSFEFSLGNLLEHVGDNFLDCDAEKLNTFDAAIKYFYAFFSKPSLVSDDDSELLVDEVLRYSRKYVSQAEEDLKDRFVDAMKFSCNGYFRAAKKEKLKLELSDIRNISESHLFNILFIRNCEMKGVLPLGSNNYKKISLSHMIDIIDQSSFDPTIKETDVRFRYLKKKFNLSYYFENSTFKLTGTELYENLMKLTKVISRGDFGFEVHGFEENVFSREECRVASKAKLNNEEMIKILHQLCFIESEILSKKFQQIPYNAFSPRQLGSIYESLLEYQIDQAPHDMIYKKKGKVKSWQKADLKLKKNLKYPSVKKKELFFTPDNKERKATGSYYTPGYIVQYIVKETLGPLVKGKGSKEILKLKVCDLAMGSGHFLSGALDFLTNAYLKALDNELTEGDVLPLPEAKRKVLDACIYGVDINPRAVKLAKMSLWLESAYQGNKLERLDDQLFGFNSLSINCWQKYYGDTKFDAIIGNPPYLSIRALSKGQSNTKKEIKDSGFYKTAVGCFDLYVPFIELAINGLVKDSGYVGQICPNKLTIADYANKLRTLIVDSCDKCKIVNLSECRVFKDASVYPYLYLFRKSKAIGNLVLDCQLHNPADEFELNGRTILALNEKLKKNAIWNLSKPIKSSPLIFLEELCEVEAGIPGYQAHSIKKIISDGRKTSKTYIPFIVSGNIKKGKIEIGSLRYMKDKYEKPHIFLDSNLLSSGKIELFKAKKVLIAGMTKEIRSYYQDSPLGVGVGVFCIRKSKVDLRAISAVLNSVTYSCLFRADFQAKHLAGGYLAINAGNLKKSRVPSNISSLKVSKRLIEICERQQSDKYSTKHRLIDERFILGLFGVSSNDLRGQEYLCDNSLNVLKGIIALDADPSLAA